MQCQIVSQVNFPNAACDGNPVRVLAALEKGNCFNIGSVGFADLLCAEKMRGFLHANLWFEPKPVLHRFQHNIRLMSSFVSLRDPDLLVHVQRSARQQLFQPGQRQFRILTDPELHVYSRAFFMLQVGINKLSNPIVSGTAVFA